MEVNCYFDIYPLYFRRKSYRYLLATLSPRAALDVMAKRNIPALTSNPNLVVQPAA
jgi:hypothetical protein